jgi:hypothetical protein
MGSPLNKINTLWQSIGGAILAPIIIMLILIDYSVYGYLSTYESLMWLNVAFLFFHQFEDYILNPNGLKNFFNHFSAIAIKQSKSKAPMSENLIFVVNMTAWVWAILAAVFANPLPWLGMSFLIANSIVNLFAHTVLFQLYHKAYNPGLITAVFLFIPLYTITIWYSIAYYTLNPANWALAIIIAIVMTALLSLLIRDKKNK